MSATTQTTTEAQYNEAIIQAVAAAEGKAYKAHDDCGHAPIDHASQKALERSDLNGSDFGKAYSEVFQNTHYAVQSERDTVEVLSQLYNNLTATFY
jgi:hypothetical protein